MQWCLGGGVFISPAPAYADGYVDGTGNNIYYGFKTDASYAEAHFNIDVEYYDTFDHAKVGGTEGRDPLGKYVRVHYRSNSKDQGVTADEWKFRPMWWFGVPAGLKDPQYIHFKRIEKLTKTGNQPFKPAGSSQQITTDANGYGAVSDRHYSNTKEWSNLSNFYFSGKNIASKGWKQLVGLGDKEGSNTYDNAGNTEKQWDIYKQDTQGLKGIFVDWESAGRRWYDMTYVSEMEETTWKNRDKNPLRFAAGVYRFAGNWHYAAGQKHDTPKIADYLKLVYPEVTKVKNPSNVTPTEQKAIKEKIENANANTKYYKELVADNGVVVNQDGSATITFKDNTKRTIPASLLVAKDETDKDKYRPALPTRTPVVNLNKLTSDEKTNIRQAIIDANGGSSPNEFLKHVKKNADGSQYEFKVNEDGSVEVTYEDDSKLTIPAEDLVFQGPKISDWAPYTVPSPIEVKDPSKLDQTEQKKVTDAFDTANADLDVYTKAKKNGQTPVTFDKDFNNAIITWADGSTTEIPSWQFLKKKEVTPAPNPQPPTPAPAEKNTFTVDLPPTPGQVIFDPFDKTATVDQQVISSLESQLKKRTAKDANDPSKSVTITSATISIADGTVTFKAEGYEDKVYPIGIFYKKKVTGDGHQNPTQQTPTSKTDTDPNNNKNTYKYFVTKTQISEAKVSDVTAQEVVKALKQFVKDNYTGWTEQELEHVTSNVAVGKNWKAKNGTTNLEPFNNGNGRILSISVSNDNGLTVNGYQYADQEDNNIDVSTDGPLFTISADDLYAPNSGSQTPTDNTVEKLKELAKQIRDQRKNAGELTEDAINTLGATDDKINSMNDEKALRDLIKKISDYQKPKPVEYKYNFEKLTLDHEGDLTDDDYKKIVVEQFLKKNYTTTDNTNWSKLEGAYNNKTIVLSGNNANTYGLTPVASGTSGLNIYTGDKQAGGVTSVVVDSNTGDLVVRGWKPGSKGSNAEELIRIKKADLFTPKDNNPKPTPSTDDLNKLKKQAEELIDRNPKLTKEQKDGYKTRIGQAKDKKAILDILKEANEQAGNNNVTPEQLKEKEKKDKENKEKEQKEKDEKEREQKQKEQTTKDKQTANTTIDNLSDLTQDEKDKLKEKLNGQSGDTSKPGATTPEEVQQIVNEAQARNAAHKAIKKELPFLDHGNASDDKKSETSHADDVALHELLGGTPGKDQTLTDLEDALKATNATAESINNALAKAKLQNTSNEQNAKNAGIAKLEAKKAELDAAYNALTDEKKKSAKDKYEAALAAINTAKESVKKATTPSQIKTALDNLKTAIGDANTAIENAKGKRNTSQNTYDEQSELNNEKEAQKKRIQDSNLPDADKQKIIEDINNATKVGDPTAIANHALKHKKIEDAKNQIDKLKHLNKAQKKYYEDLLDSTDASDHVDEDGKSTGKDDIDDALEQALNLNGVMKRLADLATSADTLKNDTKYSTADKDKRDAFDAALKAANTQLDKVKDADSDNINADGANALYGKLLEAMKALDNTVTGVGLYTDDLQKEYNDDVALTDKPVYKNATKNVKEAFDAAVTAAKAALENATKNPTALGADAAAQQNAIGAALANLVNTRKALDGIDTTALQNEVNKDKPLKNDVKYNNASTDKKNDFDKALAAAEDAIADAEGKKQLAAGQDPKTQEQKQKAVDDALTALQKAANALDGKETTPTPVNPTPVTPTPTPAPSPSVDKSHLQQGINDGSDVHNSDDYNNAPSDKKQAYDHALDHANEVNNDPNATQDQVNQAAEDLHNAQKDLHDSATVDKSYLQWEVSDDVAFRGRGSYLVADASLKDAYNEALSEARSVLSDANATQEQVNAALAKLREAKRNILQANGLSGDEYAGDGTPGTSNTGSTPGTGNTGTGNTGTGDFGFGNTGTVPGSGVVPGTVPGSVPGSGDSGFGSTGSTNAGTTAGTTNSGSGHEGDASHGFGVNDNAPTTVDKGELNLQIEGAESGSKPGSNSGAAGNGSNSAAGAAGSNASAGTTGAAGNAAGSNAGNASAGSAAANGAAANGLAAAKVNAVVENSQAVKRADAQVAAAEAAVNTALAEAKKVAADPNATQAQVDAAAQKLADARKSLAAAQDNASRVRAVVREQVLKSFKGSKLSKTGSDVSVFGMFAAGVAAAGAALFVSKRRGISRHCSK